RVARRNEPPVHSDCASIAAVRPYRIHSRNAGDLRYPSTRRVQAANHWLRSARASVRSDRLSSPLTAQDATLLLLVLSSHFSVTDCSSLNCDSVCALNVSLSLRQRSSTSR